MELKIKNNTINFTIQKKKYLCKISRHMYNNYMGKSQTSLKDKKLINGEIVHILG